MSGKQNPTTTNLLRYTPVHEGCKEKAGRGVGEYYTQKKEDVCGGVGVGERKRERGGGGGGLAHGRHSL